MKNLRLTDKIIIVLASLGILATLILALTV